MSAEGVMIAFAHNILIRSWRTSDSTAGKLI